MFNSLKKNERTIFLVFSRLKYLNSTFLFYKIYYSKKKVYKMMSIWKNQVFLNKYMKMKLQQKKIFRERERSFIKVYMNIFYYLLAFVVVFLLFTNNNRGFSLFVCIFLRVPKTTTTSTSSKIK